jgi:hypothetical protein
MIPRLSFLQPSAVTTGLFQQPAQKAGFHPEYLPGPSTLLRNPHPPDWLIQRH